MGAVCCGAGPCAYKVRSAFAENNTRADQRPLPGEFHQLWEVDTV